MPRWNDEARRQQAEIARQRKPWMKSTGPRTDAGKKRSAANAITTHGLYTDNGRRLLAALKMQKALLATLSASIPAQAGIQTPTITDIRMDPRFHGDAMQKRLKNHEKRT